VEHNIIITVGEIINIVKEKYLSEGLKAIYDDGDWFIYHNEDGRLFLSTVCCITASPDFDEETDEEIMPEFAVENGMNFPMLPEIVQDVVICSVNQKNDVTDEEIIMALNYYLENDTFMPF